MIKSDIGLVGLAVMGENLALNLEQKGYRVSLYNRLRENSPQAVDSFLANKGKNKHFIGTHSPKEFIESLKTKRNACGYSQSRLAKELHISRQNLNEIENGKTRASKEMKHTLLHYLDYCKCTQPFTLNVDYLRVRFPTTDALAIIKDVLAMKIEYFVHEDYGLFGYEELYRYG